MTNRTHRLGALVGLAAAAAFTLGAVAAHPASAAPGSTVKATTDTDDNLVPGATHITGTAGGPALTAAECGGKTPPAGSVTCFAVPGNNPQIVVFCTTSVAGGTTPATGTKPFAIKPLPTFTDNGGPCKDSLNGTDTNVASGSWKLAFIDAPSDETKTEPNPTGDKLKITVPLNGVTVTNQLLGCTIIVNPDAAHGGNSTKPFPVVGSYDDNNTLTVTINNLPVSTIGGSCPLPLTTTTSFHAVYIFSPGVHDAS